MRISLAAIGLALLEATIAIATIEYSLIPQPDKSVTIRTKAPNQLDDLTLYVAAPPEGHSYHLSPVNMTTWEITLDDYLPKNKRATDSTKRSLLSKRSDDGCMACQG